METVSGSLLELLHRRVLAGHLGVTEITAAFVSLDKILTLDEINAMVDQLGIVISFKAPLSFIVNQTGEFFLSGSMNENQVWSDGKKLCMRVDTHLYRSLGIKGTALPDGRFGISNIGS